MQELTHWGATMGKDDVTWLNICYVIFAGIVAYVFYKAINTIGIQFGLAERYDSWFPLLNNIGAVVLGAVSAIWLRSDADRREYHLSAISEIRKVNWPSIDDTKKMTLIVVIVVAIFAVILAIFDIAWSKVLQTILP